MVSEVKDVNQTDGETSFEEMLEQSFMASEVFEPGEKLSAPIVDISEE